MESPAMKGRKPKSEAAMLLFYEGYSRRIGYPLAGIARGFAWYKKALLN